MDRQTSSQASKIGPYPRLRGGRQLFTRDGETLLVEDDLPRALYVVSVGADGENARILSGPFSEERRAIYRALLDESFLGISGVAILDLREHDAEGNPIDWVDPEQEARRRAIERDLDRGSWAEGDYWQLVEAGEIA